MNSKTSIFDFNKRNIINSTDFQLNLLKVYVGHYKDDINKIKDNIINNKYTYANSLHDDARNTLFKIKDQSYKLEMHLRSLRDKLEHE